MIGENRYQKPEVKGTVNAVEIANEYGFLIIRYEQPNPNISQLISTASDLRY